MKLLNRAPIHFGVVVALTAFAFSSFPLNTAALFAQEEETKSELNIFYLSFIKADQALDVISSLALKGSENARAAVDLNTNSLIVSATPDKLREISKLLEVLDRNPAENAPKSEIEYQNVQLELYWMIEYSGVESADEVEFFKIPDTISDAVETKLAPRVKDGQLELISSSSILLSTSVPDPNVSSDKSSKSGTKFIVGGAEAVIDGLSHSVYGTVGALSDTQFAVSLDLELSYLVREKKSSTKLSTELVTKPNHPVCLAFAQTGKYPSYLVLIVRTVD